MKFAVFTDPGSREVNEDSLEVIEYEEGSCFVIADGLGGHGKGDIASQKVISAFRKVYAASSGTQSEVMKAAFDTAQADIIEEQVRTDCRAQMKSTAAALDIREDGLIWGYVGDSRIYAFSNGRVKQRTLDHSIPQALARCGEIREKDIRNHPDRNKLLRVLGTGSQSPEFELSEILMRDKYQAFLLCTDGFWELIVEKEMEKTLKKSSSPGEWMKKMTDLIRRRGAGMEMDNYSAMAVFL
ncbi:MAG: protein phosphatase 2C domain-containing protein [Clostridiales bacterium]|nr:protein phosphatase 2C domain-containing protein [Clostridiales bacterium]